MRDNVSSFHPTLLDHGDKWSSESKTRSLAMTPLIAPSQISLSAQRHATGGMMAQTISDHPVGVWVPVSHQQLGEEIHTDPECGLSNAGNNACI